MGATEELDGVSVFVRSLAEMHLPKIGGKFSLLLLIFGLVLSVPLVIGGAQLIMRLIERYPILIIAGGGLLGYVAGELIVEDSAIVGWVASHAAWLHWAAPIIGVALVIGLAKLLQRRHAARAG